MQAKQYINLHDDVMLLNIEQHHIYAMVIEINGVKAVAREKASRKCRTFTLRKSGRWVLLGERDKLSSIRMVRRVFKCELNSKK